jgi:hypothetical protein
MVEAGLINGEGGPCQAHRETAWTLHVQHPAANTGGMQKNMFRSWICQIATRELGIGRFSPFHGCDLLGDYFA